LKNGAQAETILQAAACAKRFAFKGLLYRLKFCIIPSNAILKNICLSADFN
jgi:hypothetical protein